MTETNGAEDFLEKIEKILGYKPPYQQRIELIDLWGDQKQESIDEFKKTIVTTFDLKR